MKNAKDKSYAGHKERQGDQAYAATNMEEGPKLSPIKLLANQLLQHMNKGVVNTTGAVTAESGPSGRPPGTFKYVSLSACNLDETE